MAFNLEKKIISVDTSAEMNYILNTQIAVTGFTQFLVPNSKLIYVPFSNKTVCTELQL